MKVQTMYRDLIPTFLLETFRKSPDKNPPFFAMSEFHLYCI